MSRRRRSAPRGFRYRCNHCKREVLRDSEKRWMKSYCERVGRTTRLWRVMWP